MCSLGTGLLTVIQLYSPYQHSHVDDDVVIEGEHYDKKVDLKMRRKQIMTEKNEPENEIQSLCQ